MKKFDVVTTVISEKYISNFDWGAMFLVPLIYGVLLITNTSLIWSFYEFNALFLNLALPDIFGLLFIGVAVLMLLAKKTKHKTLKALALAISSFVWSVVGIMFMFAIPSNSVWILSALMVALGWKVGAEQ